LQWLDVLVFHRNINILATTYYRHLKEKHHQINSSCENHKIYTIIYSVVIHKSYKVGTVLLYHVNNSPNTVSVLS